MKESMVNRQFSTLQRPDNEPNVVDIDIDIDSSREQVLERAMKSLNTIIT